MSGTPARSSTDLSARPSARARLPLAQLCAAGLLWGTGGAAGSVLQARTDLTPVATGFWRLAVAAALLLAWHLLAGRVGALRVPARDLPRVVAVGLLLALFQACYFAAVGRLGVAVATLLTLGSAPLLVAATTAVRARRLPAGRTQAALLTALLGLGCVVLGGDAGAGGTGGVSPTGVGLALTSGAGFAAMTLVSRGLSAQVRPLTSVTGAATVGALALAVPATLAGPVLPGVAPADLALLAYLGSGPTARASGLYLSGLRRAEPTVAALAALLEPVTATVVATALLGERLTAVAVLGGVLVLVAIALEASGTGRQERPDRAEPERQGDRLVVLVDAPLVVAGQRRDQQPHQRLHRRRGRRGRRERG